MHTTEIGIDQINKYLEFTFHGKEIEEIMNTPFVYENGTPEWSKEWAEVLYMTIHADKMPNIDGEETPEIEMELEVGSRIYAAAEALTVWEPLGISCDQYASDYLGFRLWDQELFSRRQRINLLYDDSTRFHGKEFPLSVVMPVNELIGSNIKPRESLIEGFLLTLSLVMIYGFRGRGKSWFALFLAIAIATGGNFLKWRAPKKRRVLYVDGEMSAADLRDRLMTLCSHNIPDMLEIISSELFRQKSATGLILNDVDHQVRFKQLLTELIKARRKPEVIIFDNLSSMSNTDENNNSEQESLLAFLRDLRHLGYTVIVLHHSGKNSEQRGASRREDFLDLSIKLGDPSVPETDGARFKMSIVKCRGRMPTPNELECSVVTDQHGRLELVSSESEFKEPQKWVQCLRYIQENNPINQKQLVEALDMKASNVSSSLRKAREMGLLVDLTLTQDGVKYLAKVYKDSTLPEK